MQETLGNLRERQAVTDEFRFKQAQQAAATNRAFREQSGWWAPQEQLPGGRAKVVWEAVRGASGCTQKPDAIRSSWREQLLDRHTATPAARISDLQALAAVARVRLCHGIAYWWCGSNACAGNGAKVATQRLPLHGVP